MRTLATALLAVAAAAARGWGGQSAPLSATPAVTVAPRCVRDGALLQATPAAAFGKKVYLVAWSDGSRMLGKETADITCARVEPGTGRSLDPEGIVVCRAQNLQGRPAVAFDGSRFLVVWQDLRNGTDYDVYAARVGEDGKVLDPDGFAVIRRASNQARPAAAFAAGRTVVVWMDARQYPVYGLYFARVSPAGKVLDGDGLPLDAGEAARIAKVRPPRGTWLGDRQYWWHDLASRTAPAAASNGRECLVAYMREYPFAGSGRPALTTARIRPGDASRTEPVKVTGGPAPAWTGKGWVLGGPVWKGGWTPQPRLGAALLGAMVTPSSRGDAQTMAMPSGMTTPLATVDLVAAVGGGYNVGKGSTASFPSCAAFGAPHAIVAMQYAWRPSRRDPTPTFAILAVRLSVEGGLKVLDAKPQVLASAASPACVNHPALAAGPAGECLLVYEHDTDVKKCVITARIVRTKED